MVFERGSIGPDYFVELLNRNIAVYDKTGARVEGPMDSNEFFEFDDSGVTYPIGNTYDPRVLFDHENNRWIACMFDDGSKDFLLAISQDDQPVPLSTHWDKFRLPFQRGIDVPDFTTMGLDHNGIYVSAFYIPSLSNQVVAIHKNLIYQNPPVFQYWTFPLQSSTPFQRIVQPAVNFAPSPVGNYAWMVTKGIPQRPSGQDPYLGGAIFYRRLQWVDGEPDWADTGWVEVPEPEPTYRDYFDLDSDDWKDPNVAVFAAQPEGRFGPINIKLSLPPNGAGGVGSRLSMVVIRDGILWTCQHVGLDSPDGSYHGDDTGASVDRSAVQWLKLPINANGELEAVNNDSHGRIYDDCATDPLWYYHPSLMVNSAGDMVLGFSGSSQNSFIGAYYYWRLANGESSLRPPRMKDGEDAFGTTRWGDFSYTSLDPADGSIWTVQEYARPFDPISTGESMWGTWISRIIP